MTTACSSTDITLTGKVEYRKLVHIMDAHQFTSIFNVALWQGYPHV